MFRRLAGDGAGSDGGGLMAGGGGGGGGGASWFGGVDLVEEARRSFADVAADINGALVYMDEGAGEAAHFACGASFLFSLGALNVLSLEAVGGGRANDDCGDDPATAPPSQLAPVVPVDFSGLPAPPAAPVVIFITRMLHVADGDVRRCIGAHPSASRVTVFCTVSEVGSSLSFALPSPLQNTHHQSSRSLFETKQTKRGGGGGRGARPILHPSSVIHNTTHATRATHPNARRRTRRTQEPSRRRRMSARELRTREPCTIAP